MTTMQKPASRRRTRKSRVEDGESPRINPKLHSQEGKGLSEFIPSSSQKTLINKIRENTIVFIDSEAGTGKSSAVLYHFAKEYLANQHLNIYIVRTPVEAGDDRIGYLPDGVQQKIAPHMESSKILLENFLGKGKVADDLEHRIFFKIPNYMLGHTFDNALILIDEAQQISPIILKLILERTGSNTKVVVAGCSSQIYASDRKRNALADAVVRFFDEEKEPKYPDIGYHEFDLEECHRDPVVKSVIRAYRGV